MLLPICTLFDMLLTKARVFYFSFYQPSRPNFLKIEKNKRDFFFQFIFVLEFNYVFSFCLFYCTGAQFEGDLGEILVLGAEISPYIGLREKWESP